MSLILTAALVAVPAVAIRRTAACTDAQYVASKADLIVHGAVAKVEAREGKGGMINTYVTVTVDRVLKGRRVKSLTVKRLGGSLVKDGQTRSVSDGDGPWLVKPGDSGYLHLSKPRPTYYESKYYGLVCGWGMTQEVPRS